MTIRMVRRRAGGIEVLVPAGLEGMTLLLAREEGESDAEYYAAVSMYQGLFGRDFHIRERHTTSVGTICGHFLMEMGYAEPDETRADFLAVNSIETAAEDGKCATRTARRRAVKEAVEDVAKFGGAPSVMCREQMRLFVAGDITAEQMRKHVIHHQQMTKRP